MSLLFQFLDEKIELWDIVDKHSTKSFKGVGFRHLLALNAK